MTTRKQRPLVDLTGQVFGRYIVLKEGPKRLYGDQLCRTWICKCECGVIRQVRGGSLCNGLTKSCGCLKRDLIRTHGMSGTPEHDCWIGMWQRCTNPKNEEFVNYGGRGIRVSAEWESFERFFADMGPKPTRKHSIERQNNELGYGPSNCCWALNEAQCNNTRRNLRIDFMGRTQTLMQWAREFGIEYNSAFSRFRKGWPMDRVLAEPPQPRRISWRGRTQTILEWARELRMDSRTLRSRFHRGWSAERAFTAPLDPRGH